ncbi:hypothetical protein GW17_00026268 [Ensete ventricosum]|nr:hypothetical protein GW17_00026268 [Ensete ventricosum]RZR82927.1 hypothetical protein BHM03_00009465 [Ensete ventricosum]
MNWFKHGGASKAARFVRGVEESPLQVVDKDFPTLRGHPKAREHAELAAELASQLPEKTTKEFKIYRWNPDEPRRKPFLQSFFVDLSTCGPMQIKAEQDPSLSYRRSCREGICGSCSMNIDGNNTVACLKPVDADTSTATMITPLPHMFVIKDLVVDLTNFYQQHKCGHLILLQRMMKTIHLSLTLHLKHGLRRLIEPWLKTKKPPEKGREHLQSPRERKKLDGLYECILCACCSTACPAYWWNQEAFLGPAALLHAFRWVSDSRDEFTKERIQGLTEDEDKLYRCRTIKNCTAACPKSLDPAKAISAMRTIHQLH